MKTYQLLEKLNRIKNSKIDTAEEKKLTRRYFWGKYPDCTIKRKRDRKYKRLVKSVEYRIRRFNPFLVKVPERMER